MENNKDLVLTLSELEDVLKIGRNTTLKLIYTENFPKIHIGKRILIPVVELERWLVDNTGQSIEI